MVHNHYYPFHRHHHCPMGGEHDKRYCSECGITYCEKCGREWGQRTIWPSYPRHPWDYPVYLCKH